MALFEDLAVRYIRDLIADFGLEDYQAAGIVGNGGHESGGFTQLQELHPTSGRGGLGHFQWTGPRRVAFEAWLARHPEWTPATYEANYSMLFRELVGPEKASLEAVKQAASAEDATRVFCEKFERPGVVAVESRLKWTQRALDAWHASAGKMPATVEILPPLDPGKVTDGLAQIQAVIKLVEALRQPPQITAPPPPPVQSGTPVSSRPSVWLSTLAAVGAALFQAHGDLGTPVGPNASTAGLMTNVLTIGSAVFGAVGGWAGIGKMALAVLRLIPK